MSLEVFINEVSTYSLQEYNIAFVKFNKKTQNLEITNTGLPGELKTTYMNFAEFN